MPDMQACDETLNISAALVIYLHGIIDISHKIKKKSRRVSNCHRKYFDCFSINSITKPNVAISQQAILPLPFKTPLRLLKSFQMKIVLQQ
jgi:hypothetical protein